MATEAETLHGWFARQAALTPDATALTTTDTSVSYGELLAAAGQVATLLVEAGVRPGTLVPVCVARGHVLPAILGVLMAGAAYVPLEPRYPDTRLAELVGRVGADVLVTDQELAARVRTWFPGTLVRADDSANGMAAPSVAVAPDDLAYVMFTSGSTGTPKGVQITHRNVTRLMAGTAGIFDIGADDVWTMLHSFAFDFSVWEMWGALLFGGRLVVVDDDTARAPDELLALIDHEGVTVLSQTPSALAALASADESRPARLDRLRLIVLGGERLDPATLRGWFARHGDVRPSVVNMYGITETTVHVTYRRIVLADAMADAGGSPIGVPLPDLAVSLRNADGTPTPVDDVGEIWVSGPGLARGYFGDVDATGRAFRVLTWGPGDQRRSYRSGDLARADADGQLRYVGRRDDQVKVRGYRVELGEVGAALRAHPDVVDVCVSTDTGDSVGTRLLAWAVVRRALDVDVLRAFLSARLPGHMVPGELWILDRLPLTPNGKVDRRALVARARAVPAEGSVYRHGDTFTAAVAGIWAEELGVGVVEPGDDFFDLGGHSLLVMNVISRTRAELGADVPVRTLFEAPRLADFVHRVRLGIKNV